MKLRKEIPECGLYPAFYGVAWDEWRTVDGLATVVCYPVPLNILMGVLRRWFLWFRSGRGWRQLPYEILYQENESLRIEVDELRRKLSRLEKKYVLG